MRPEEEYQDDSDEGNVYGMPWKRDTEIDKTLLIPRASSQAIKLSVPRYEPQQIAVVVEKSNGTPVRTKDGKKIYRMQQEKVLTGFETSSIDLPGKEVYNVDLTSTYLTHEEAVALRTLISLYADVQLKVLTGKDWIEDLYYIYNRIMGIVDTAKSREGKTARLSKTSIAEGSSKQQIIEDFRKEQSKRAWTPGRF
jgi:hypothetical protein